MLAGSELQGWGGSPALGRWGPGAEAASEPALPGVLPAPRWLRSETGGPAGVAPVSPSFLVAAPARLEKPEWRGPEPTSEPGLRPWRQSSDWPAAGPEPPEAKGGAPAPAPGRGGGPQRRIGASITEGGGWSDA